MKKLITAILIGAMCMNLVSGTALAESSDSVYVYVDGNVLESGDGSFDAPFKTLQDAQQEVRNIIKRGYPKDGVTVSIRGGDYKLLETLKFGPEDSGTKEAPVVWRSYGNEKVNIMGGAEVKFGDFKKVTNQNVLDKLDVEVQNNVYELDLDTKGIDVYDDFGVAGQAAATMNSKGKNPTNGASLPAIYWEGTPTNIARYPNDGNYLTVEKVLSPGSTSDYTQNMSFTTADSRISKWMNTEDAWLWGMLYHDWADIHLPIKGFDDASGAITTKYSCDYGVRAGQRFFVYNILEELDSPGEWYVDREAKKLYMYPLEKDKDATIMLAFGRNNILDFKYANYITFRDVGLKGTRATAVGINMCRGISIKYCEIAYASGNGVTANGDPGGRTFGDSSYEIVVEGCHIHTLGGQGVYMHYVGNRGDLTPGNCVVKNCWIHDFGMLVKTYAGAVSTRGHGIEISHNLMHDGSHLAVNPGGSDTIVKYNDISNVLKETLDSGAIYFGGDTANRGVVIENNYIHDCTTDATGSHQIHAVYIDDAGAGATVNKNMISNVGGNGVFINGGRDNTVENNVFADLTGVGVILKASFLSGSWYANWETGKLGDAVFRPVVDYTSEPFKKYPHLADIENDDPPFPKYNSLQNNVTYNSQGGQTIDPMQSGYTIKEIASWGTVGNEIVTNKDIGFKDAKNKDYELNDDSSVYTDLPDFEKIDYERIGLITSRLRTVLHKDAVAMVIGEPRSYVNWERKMIDENNFDVVPFITNNRTYVPVRYLFEAFGATVEWKDGKADISYNGKTITLEQHTDKATVDGKEVLLGDNVLNLNGRIFVPLRACSGLIEKKVFWDDKGLIVVSGNDVTEKFSYEEMVDDLIGRLSER